ncbi:hypothetical protein T09_12976 [Trichinella sp. T9]|nr:hypothetical protein T09_12976 [Trichinella sp. T9]
MLKVKNGIKRWKTGICAVMSATGVEPLPFIYLFHLSNFLSNSLVIIVYFLSTCFPLDCEHLASFTLFYAKFPLFHVKCRKTLKMSLTGYGSDTSSDLLNDFPEESEYRQCQRL